MRDIVIVGGGPAGLNAAVVAGRMRRKAALVDAGAGRNNTAEQVHNLLTRDGIAPNALRTAALDDLKQYASVEAVADTVSSIGGTVGEFEITLDNGTVESARRVLLTTGLVDDLPDIPGLSKLWGQSALHCPYCHGYEVRDEPLAVLITDPFAFLTANRLLSGMSDDVVVCTNNADVLDQNQRAMLEGKGAIIAEQPIDRFESHGDALHRIVFSDGTSLERTAIFLHPAKRQASGLPDSLGCTMFDDGIVAIDEAHHTSVPGVFAAGDLARRDGALIGREQVGVAAAAGLTAATCVDQELTFAG